jgi:hypothetical protein
MTYDLDKAIQILERTPDVLQTLLGNISPDWTNQNEGGDTWSGYEVVGHLLYCEKADWIVRAEIILSENSDKKFEPFDRFAHLKENKGASLRELLEQFKSLRNENIARLRAKDLTDKDLSQKGIHPAFGDVTLSQLLSTWVVHDLNHIAQIARVMAKQYKEAVGPWIAYLRILQS